MKKREKIFLQKINNKLNQILRGDFNNITQDNFFEPEFKDISDSVEKLATSLKDAQDFILSLSHGNLDVDPPPYNKLIGPFKQLHANLKHLTWQTKQISSGDLNQRVDFLGEFSVSFNLLIEALREKKVTEENLFYISLHDPLTDLYNRRYFEEEIARTKRSRNFPISIIMADLDDLKKVNDSLGHAAGDMMIKDTAKILKQVIRADDVLARIGGDEFAIILPNADGILAADIVERIRKTESEVNNVPHHYHISISLGIATSKEEDSLIDTLREADKKMYYEKFSKKNK
jgi:two-component system, cell cycle response regulator